MSDLIVRPDSVVAFHELHFSPSPDGEVEIGRADTGVFISLDEAPAALLRWLVDGDSMADAAERFTSAYGMAVDVPDFVRELSGCGFVAGVDGVPSDQGEEAPAQGWHLFGSLPQERVAWLVSRPVTWTGTAVLAALPVVLVTRPDLVPRVEDAVLGSGIFGNLAGLTFIGWTLVLFHEVAHLLAVRARGCQATLDLSHRLHILVAQTDMSSVRVLPRSARYAPYLAGMTWDATLLLAIVGLRAGGWTHPATDAASYLLLMSLLFQLALFLRTDVYYVLTNALRLGNLVGDARSWFSNRLLSLVGRPPAYDLSDVPARELRYVRLYAVVAAFGVAVAIGEFVFLGLPLLLEFVEQADNGLSEPLDTAAYWSSVGTLAIVALQFALLGVAVYRERRRRRHRAAAAQ